MPKPYSPTYEKFYQKLSRLTGMSKEEVDMVMLKITKILINDLNRDGKVYIPYLGKFYLKRMPPRKRHFKDFTTDETYLVDIPAQDKLKFIINREFSKLFR